MKKPSRNAPLDQKRPVFTGDGLRIIGDNCGGLFIETTTKRVFARGAWRSIAGADVDLAMAALSGRGAGPLLRTVKKIRRVSCKGALSAIISQVISPGARRRFFNLLSEQTKGNKS